VEKKPVARWDWQTEEIKDIDGLRRLARNDLMRTVLRLRLSGSFRPDAFHEAQGIVARLVGDDLTDGAAGAVVREGAMELDSADIEAFFAESPEEIRWAGERSMSHALRPRHAQEFPWHRGGDVGLRARPQHRVRPE
jgi:hypothetical protein